MTKIQRLRRRFADLLSRLGVLPRSRPASLLVLQFICCHALSCGVVCAQSDRADLQIVYRLDDTASDMWLARPQIILMEGSLVVSVEIHGARSTFQRRLVFSSADLGATWLQLPELREPGNGTMFAEGKHLWYVGVDGPGEMGMIRVRGSDNGGATWSDPAGQSTEGLRGVDTAMLCSVRPARTAGRLALAFVRYVTSPGCDLRAHVVVATAGREANLLDPANWRWSSELSLDCLGGIGSIGRRVSLFHQADDRLALMMRSLEGQCVGMASLSPDGWRLNGISESCRQQIPAGLREWHDEMVVNDHSHLALGLAGSTSSAGDCLLSLETS